MFGSPSRSLMLLTALVAGIALAASGSTASAAGAKAPKRMAYFTDLDAGLVYGVQIKFKKKPKLKLKKTFAGVANPWGVALDPDEKFLLVTDNVLDTVTKLGLPSGAVQSTVSVGDGPTDVAITPDGDYAFIVNRGDNTVSVYDTRTDRVIETLAMRRGPLRIEMNDRGTSAYVVAIDADTLTKIDVSVAVGNDPGNPLEHLDRSGSCDLSGGVESVRVPGAAPFNYIMWTCGSGVTGGARMDSMTAAAESGGGASGRPSHSGSEDTSKDCMSMYSSSDDPCNERNSGRRARIDPAVRTPFEFSVPGSPVEMETVGLARAPSYLDGGVCTTNSLVTSYRDVGAAEGSLAGSVSYLWRFGQTAVELADGYAFGPLFGGAGDRVYANPICGARCNPKKIAKKTKELKIPGAENVIDGAMLPVPFGDDC